MQGYVFMTTVGILPLKCFDMFLGQDWLEECSPMWIHWAKKVMRFTLHGQRITLRGLSPGLGTCTQVSGAGLKGLLTRKAVT